MVGANPRAPDRHAPTARHPPSDYLNETNTNWSSLLSAWDYLHRTIRLDVPQQAIETGMPAYQDPKKGDARKDSRDAVPPAKKRLATRRWRAVCASPSRD